MAASVYDRCMSLSPLPTRGDIDAVIAFLSRAEREAREVRDFRRSQAAYGIGWAIETGRAPLEAIAYVVADPEAVLAKAAEACDTIGDVPGWLIRQAFPA